MANEQNYTMQAMKPTPIIELVGKDVNGIVVDIRTVNPDGSLRYEHTEKEGPHMVTLRKVELKRKSDGQWLFWRWDGYSCGFSGIRLDRHDTSEYCLMMPEVK